MSSNFKVHFATLARLASPLMVGLALNTGIASAAEEVPDSAWRQFDIDGKTMSVRPDSNADGTRSYEVLAEDNGLVMSRLLVNRNGVLSNAWKTDLDGDGSPEVVVAISQLNGTNEGAVDIHEWDGYKFDSVQAPRKIAAEKSVYDGHDQFEFAAGKLRRAFPRFTQAGENRVPTGETASYQFDMQSGQWIAP